MNHIGPATRTTITSATIVAAALALAPRSTASRAITRGERPGPVDRVIAAPGDMNYSYGPRLADLRRSLAVNPSARITVTYDSGFDSHPEARAAFQAAVDIWSTVISSPVTITVNATFDDLDSPTVLGYAAPGRICLSDSGAADTWYPAALADRLAEDDVCAVAGTGVADIEASFNSAFANWDFNTNGVPVAGRYNFLTVVLHEICHGLGFYGSMDVSGGVGYWGEAPGEPDIYDRFAVTREGVPLLSFASGSQELGFQLVSDSTYFDGPHARAGNAGKNPKLETALYPWRAGSSYAHIDDLTYSGSPNGLMTWALARAEVYTDPGPIVRGMLADEGWTSEWVPPSGPVPPCPVSLAPPSVILPLSGGSGTIKVAAADGCTWTAGSDAAFITVTSPVVNKGSGSVGYTVAPATAARSGHIRIGDAAFTIDQAPALTATPAVLNFGIVHHNGAVQFGTPPQEVTLAQSGPGEIAWSAVVSHPWLSLTPASGTGVATVRVSIDHKALVFPPSGSLTGTITFASIGGVASPTVVVNLALLAAHQASPAIGVVDTPLDNQTGVTGSLPITGWAIDDIGVTRVRIFRDPVEGETGFVFIGDAVLVNGARGDIAAAYPAHPLKDQAGWGYLLLTNFLPRRGNGSFRLHVYAEDVEGHSTLIGSRTITCANASATAPFGAIDTPAQGATVSGSSFVNFGWVLTPPPGSIAANGQTVTVLIDSMPVGSPTDGGPLTARSDIQALFADGHYANIDHHLGLKVIDTTRLANGVHTIAWVVTDNFGRSAGIGSRFFTVANSAYSGSEVDSAGSVENSRRTRSIDAQPRVVADRAMLAGVPSNDSALVVRRGFEAAATELVVPDRAGIRHVRTAQLDRVEIALRGADTEQATWRGYTVEGNVLRALPVGATLDAASGSFAWAPGLAFGGTVDLVFIRTSSVSPRGGRSRREEQIRVRIHVAPRTQQ